MSVLILFSGLCKKPEKRISPLGLLSSVYMVRHVWMNWTGLCLLFLLTLLIWSGSIAYGHFLLHIGWLCFSSRAVTLSLVNFGPDAAFFSSVIVLRCASLVSLLCCVFHSVLDGHIVARVSDSDCLQTSWFSCISVLSESFHRDNLWECGRIPQL